MENRRAVFFDADMAFMAERPVTCISLPNIDEDSGKSFQKMLREWKKIS